MKSFDYKWKDMEEIPLAIFWAASSTVMAAGYALPLTASMKAVIPRASLSNNARDVR